MGTKIPWSRQEAAILLDAYIDVIKGKHTRTQIIKRVSADLRKMATNNGLKIDEIFRNENGIYFQMQSMESAYHGRTVMKSASSLFTEIVTLYKENSEEYEKLLKEARSMIDGKINIINNRINYKDTFSSWLARTFPPTRVKALLASCEVIEQHCLKLKILKGPLFETKDLGVIKNVRTMVLHNKLFRIINKNNLKYIDIAMFYLLRFVKEGNFEKISCKTATMQDLSGVKQPETRVRTEKSQNVVGNLSEPYVRTEQDRRLLAKYPLVYKRIFSTLRELHEHNQGGATITELYERINHIARCSDLEDILDNVSWSAYADKRYIFSEKIVQHYKAMNFLDDDTKVISSNSEQDIYVVSFTDIRDYTYSKPTSFTYFGEPVLGCTSWKSLYVAFFANLYADYHNLLTEGMSFTHTGSGRLDLCKAGQLKKMTAPKPIPGSSLYLETNLSAKDIVHKIKFLLDLCQIDYEQVIIKYEKKRPDKTINVQSDKKDTSGINVVNLSLLLPPVDNKYLEVLNSNFRKGFRLGSPIELRRFKHCYEQMYEEALNIDDAIIEQNIKVCGIFYEDKVYVPQVMLGDETRERLFTYIQKSFDEGKTTLYYQAIFNEFSEELLDYLIYNADMLKAYLSYMLRDKYYFGKAYVSTDANITADPIKEVRDCLMEYAAPVTYNVMFENLPHIPQQKIKQILATNDEFVSNGRGEYFHISATHFSDEEMDNIADIINSAITDKKYLSGNELIEAIKSKYPYIYENNSSFSIVGLRDAIKYYLCRKFSFSGNIISKLGSYLTMSDVFADYCRNRDTFTLDELNVLAGELGTIIYFDPVYENSLRINHDHFVAKSRAKFLVPETDAVIDRFCRGDYISIEKINGYSQFPNAGFPWNEYLLEHYVAAYSDKYMLLHTGFNANKCVGAIVKKSAGFENFDDCIVAILADSDITLKKQQALQYLCDEGYIARRIYTNIEELLIRATALRNRKEAK